MFAPEGFGYIFATLLLLTGSGLLALLRKRPLWLVLTGIFGVLYVLMMVFFRDPARPQPDPRALVAPTDGRVLAVEETSEGRVHVTLYLDLFDVHAIRSPASGKVVHRRFVPGRFWRAFTDRAGRENQRVRVRLATEHGPLQFEVLAGAVTRRVVVPVAEGDSLLAGERIGFIRFGSRSEILLPPGVEAHVQVGDEVVGGVTPIGRLRQGGVEQKAAERPARARDA